ncbi:MAG: hypothetical protein PHX03_00200 [Bacilli bacterium]|nr:hypothetical protein [Bacilli bacterium]
MEKKEIPIKNYIILAIVIVATVFTTFHLANRYKNEKDYYNNSSPLREVLAEVKIEELEDYFLDNPTMVVYVVNGNDQNILDMDKTIKEFVLNNDLGNDIVVINATNNIDLVTSKLSQMLNSNLKQYNKDLLTHANLLFVDDRIIEDVLVPKTMDNEILTNFFIKNGVM